jgi:hypothetical protein
MAPLSSSMQREVDGLVFLSAPEMARLPPAEKHAHFLGGRNPPAKLVAPAYRFLHVSTRTAYDWHAAPQYGLAASQTRERPRLPRTVSQIACLSDQAPATPPPPPPPRQIVDRDRTGGASAGLPRALPAVWPKWGAPPPKEHGLGESAAAFERVFAASAERPPASPYVPASERFLGAPALSAALSCSSVASALYRPLSPPGRPPLSAASLASAAPLPRLKPSGSTSSLSSSHYAPLPPRRNEPSAASRTAAAEAAALGVTYVTAPPWEDSRFPNRPAANGSAGTHTPPHWWGLATDAGGE